MVDMFANSFLPEVHKPMDSAIVPFHPYVLGICSPSNNETWSDKGFDTCHMEDTEVQPVGRPWL